MAKETDAKIDAALVSVVDVAERERERSREGARDETNLVEEDLAASRGIRRRSRRARAGAVSPPHFRITSTTRASPPTAQRARLCSC
jgi:hypothetical protein